MNASPSLPDVHGLSVVAGDFVRILAITPDPDLDDDDRDMIEYMVGAICEVDRIEDGLAWVTMWWNNVEGVLTTSVALDPDQMERVDRQEASRASAESGRANR